MAYCRLGQTEKALDYLNRLRETMNKPHNAGTRWAKDEQACALLREAEGLISGATANPN
jgi:hypothetical protein